MALGFSKSMLRPQHVDLKLMFPSIRKSTYLTHGFDSYPAKMIPHMARFLIEKISRPGQTILDPFCGSGAVLIEALLHGRNAIGVDFNTLAVALGVAKTTVYDTSILEKQLQEILRRAIRCSRPHIYDFPNAEYWFTPATLRKLGQLKTTLDRYLPAINPSYRYFWRAVAFSIVRKCSKADMRGPKPFISKTARVNRAGRHFDPIRLFESEARKWFLIEDRYLEALRANPSKATANLIHGDSRRLSRLVSGKKVDAVITSPPYLSAQDYYRSSKLQRLIFEGVSAEQLIEWSRDIIGTDRLMNGDHLLEADLPGDLADRIRIKVLATNEKNSKRLAKVFSRYVLDMSKVLAEIGCILKKGAPCVIVLGYNLMSHIVIPTPEVIIQLASRAGLELEVRYADRIRDRWVPTIRNGHKGVIDEEHLLVFRKIV